jgi:aryl carrier-like protein
MILTIYMLIPNILVMASGKVDRGKLRSIGASLTPKDIRALSRVDGERRAPESDIEQLMQNLWSKVLDITPESISIDDNFFGIGGDSIGAMELVGMASKKGLILTVRDIFQNPILRDLAALDGICPTIGAQTRVEAARKV